MGIVILSTENVNGRPTLEIAPLTRLHAHHRQPRTWSAPGGTPRACRGGGVSPTPSSFAGGGVSWSGAVPCGTYASGPDPQRVVLPGYLRQESKLRPRETAGSRENSLSAGRCLAGLLGKDTCKCLCMQAATFKNDRSRVSLNESSSTWGSVWPLSSQVRRAGTTEASVAHPPRPPAPLHDRCSLVDVNLQHPHTGPVIQSRSSSPDIVPTLPGF